MNLEQNENLFWFKPGDFPGEEYYIRYLDDDALDEINNKYQIDNNGIVVGDGNYWLDLFNYVCIDWKGIILKNGKEAKCIRENKKMLIKNSIKRTKLIVSASQWTPHFDYDKVELLGKFVRPLHGVSNGNSETKVKPIVEDA